jgi:hypothetical protein
MKEEFEFPFNGNFVYDKKDNLLIIELHAPILQRESHLKDLSESFEIKANEIEQAFADLGVHYQIKLFVKFKQHRSPNVIHQWETIKAKARKNRSKK